MALFPFKFMRLAIAIIKSQFLFGSSEEFFDIPTITIILNVLTRRCFKIGNLVNNGKITVTQSFF